MEDESARGKFEKEFGNFRSEVDSVRAKLRQTLPNLLNQAALDVMAAMLTGRNVDTVLSYYRPRLLELGQMAIETGITTPLEKMLLAETRSTEDLLLGPAYRRPISLSSVVSATFPQDSNQYKAVKEAIARGDPELSVYFRKTGVKSYGVRTGQDPKKALEAVNDWVNKETLAGRIKQKDETQPARFPSGSIRYQTLTRVAKPLFARSSEEYKAIRSALEKEDPELTKYFRRISPTAFGLRGGVSEDEARKGLQTWTYKQKPQATAPPQPLQRVNVEASLQRPRIPIRPSQEMPDTLQYDSLNKEQLRETFGIDSRFLSYEAVTNISPETDGKYSGDNVRMIHILWKGNMGQQFRKSII